MPTCIFRFIGAYVRTWKNRARACQDGTYLLLALLCVCVAEKPSSQAHAPAPFSWMDETRGLQMAPFSRKKQKTKRGRSHQNTSITAGQPSAFQAGSCFDNTDQDGRAATTHCPVKSPSCRADSNLGDFCTTPPCPPLPLLLLLPPPRATARHLPAAVAVPVQQQ